MGHTRSALSTDFSQKHRSCSRSCSLSGHSDTAHQRSSYNKKHSLVKDCGSSRCLWRASPMLSGPCKGWKQHLFSPPGSTSPVLCQYSSEQLLVKVSTVIPSDTYSFWVLWPSSVLLCFLRCALLTAFMPKNHSHAMLAQQIPQPFLPKQSRKQQLQVISAFSLLLSVPWSKGRQTSVQQGCNCQYNDNSLFLRVLKHSCSNPEKEHLWPALFKVTDIEWLYLFSIYLSKKDLSKLVFR